MDYVQDVLTGIVETIKLDAYCNVIAGRALPPRQVSWIALAEPRVTFGEDEELMPVEED